MGTTGFEEKMETWSSVDTVVEEIMRIHRSLPSRPAIDEVEAAKVLILNVEKEDQARLESISRQSKGPEVPEELFMVLQEMQRNMVYLQSKEQKREALKLLDLENVHSLFDELIQRASKCVSSNPSGSNSDSRKHGYSNGSASTTVSTSFSKSSGSALGSSSGFDKVQGSSVGSSRLFHVEKEHGKAKELVTRDDSYVKNSKSTLYSNGYGIESSLPSKPQILDSSLKAATSAGKPYMLLNIQLGYCCHCYEL